MEHADDGHACPSDQRPHRMIVTVAKGWRDGRAGWPIPSRIGTRAHPADLAEGEHIGLDAGIEEGDLEVAVGDRAGLPDELV